MELHIKTTGLCLIVPEEDASGNPVKYHILIPETKQHVAHNALLLPNGGRQYDLGCRYLDLSALTADLGAAHLSNVVDVGFLANGSKIAKKQVGKKPEKTVSARVTLPCPTLTRPGDVARWQPYKHNGDAVSPFPSTHHMTWVFKNFNPSTLLLELRKLHEDCEVPDLETVPVPDSTDGVVCISITHLPPMGGGTLGVGEYSEHFGMYGNLFPHPARPKMQLLEAPSTTMSQITCATNEKLLPFDSETAYNCMLAQSKLG